MDLVLKNHIATIVVVSVHNKRPTRKTGVPVTVRVMASYLRFNPKADNQYSHNLLKTAREVSEHHTHATHETACKAQQDFHVDVMNSITHYTSHKHITQCSNGTQIYSNFMAAFFAFLWGTYLVTFLTSLPLLGNQVISVAYALHMKLRKYI